MHCMCEHQGVESESEALDSQHKSESKIVDSQHKNNNAPSFLYRVTSCRLLPLFIVFILLCAYILLYAVLPLHGLYFHTSLLNQLSHRVLIPARYLFPGRALTPTLFNPADNPPPIDPTSWKETAIFFAACTLLALFYLLAVRYLPKRIDRRFLLLATLLFGGICVLAPVVTSQDIFSYIAYARMGVIYHLNPLTATPLQIAQDPTYVHLYWVNQPSAYGPTWTLITSSLQWLTDLSGFTGSKNVALMVVALRLFGLAVHIWSTLLVWTVCGYLQQAHGRRSPLLQLQATLTFAWNPLLLFEACVNTHIDTIVLLFVLLTLWFLVRKPAPHASIFTCLYMAVLLAMATTTKVNIALLIPGFLFFLGRQPHPLRLLSSFCTIYLGMIVALYLPFWQGGAILNLLHVNPGTYRTINTLADFASRVYNGITPLFGVPVAPEVGSPIETIVRALSMGLFVICYIFLCARAFFTKQQLQTPVQLIRWLALIWLLYCALGTPWFWPWYTIPFFGLFALLEAVDWDEWQTHPWLRILHLPLTVRLFAFSMLSLYCFYTWAPYNNMLPGLVAFRAAYLRGAWAWLVVFLPLVSLLIQLKPHSWLPGQWRKQRKTNT